MLYKRGQAAVVGLIAVLLIVFLMGGLSVSREVIGVEIQNNQIQHFQLGFLGMKLTDALFDKIPKGDLRLYVEGRNSVTGEVIYTYSNNGIGVGMTLLTNNVKFPVTNSSLYFKVSLANKDLVPLNTKCFNLKFIVKGGNKQIGQEETNCRM